MRQIIGVILVLFVGLWIIRGCTPQRPRTKAVYNQNVTVMSEQAAEGLDLQAVLELTKTVKDAKELERKINKSGGINNLDLNNDDEVDFIKVTEFGNKNDAWGFSLTVEPVKGEEQEIAVIEIEKTGEKAEVQVRGNEQIYGQHHYYHSHFGIGEFLLLGYLMRPHPFYMSPFYYGYYPSYYAPYRTVSRTLYRSNVRGYTSGSRAQRVQSSRLKKSSTLRNPNTGKVANRGIRKSLANPTSTQRQFKARSASAGRRSGGFGRSGRSSVSRSSSGSRSSSAVSRTRRSGGFGRSMSTARSRRSYGGRSFGGGGK